MFIHLGTACSRARSANACAGLEAYSTASGPVRGPVHEGGRGARPRGATREAEREAGAQGVILYGEPGTGKTLLAKAVAHSTSATFLRVVGSELIQKYLGDGPKLVRELFRVADELAPSIVFIGAPAQRQCRLRSPAPHSRWQRGAEAAARAARSGARLLHSRPAERGEADAPVPTRWHRGGACGALLLRRGMVRSMAACFHKGARGATCLCGAGAGGGQLRRSKESGWALRLSA